MRLEHRVVLALDVVDPTKARSVERAVRGSVDAVKVGWPLVLAAGLGIALLSRHAIRMELALRRLVVLDVKGLPLRRQWYVVHRQDKRLSRAAVAFKAFLLTSAETVLASTKQPRQTNRHTRF